MNKSLWALALLGALAGPAQAQSAVQIYGNVDAGLIKRSGDSLTIGKRDHNTLGFKGTEDLGTGLKAIFQLEIRYEPDTGTVEQGGGAIQRPLFQGQSRVGLQGRFGTVRIGRGLTAFQESSIEFEPFHGIPSPSGFYTDLTVAGYTSDPLGLPGNSANRFSNAVFYNSPEFGGFQINTTVASKEANGAAAAASANPYSVSATYRQGPAALMLAAERNAVESELWSIAGSVMVNPALKLMASHTRQDREHTMATFADARAWVVGANYSLGAGKILAGYGRKSQGNPAVLATQRTTQFSLGYEYSLSKRTYIYVDASNKKAPVNPAGAGPVSSINHYSLGVNHSF